MFVEAKRSFNKPKSYLLDVIKEPGNLSYYHPFCKRHEAIQWPGPGSIDELEYLNGRTLITVSYTHLTLPTIYSV